MNLAQMVVAFLALASGVDSSRKKTMTPYEAYQSLTKRYGRGRSEEVLSQSLSDDVGSLHSKLQTEPRYETKKLSVAREYLNLADAADVLGMETAAGRALAGNVIAVIVANLAEECDPGSACDDDDEEGIWD